jgi:hypothetical protein
MATLDIIIRRARGRNNPDGLTEIGIRNGRIAAIAEHISDQARAETDAGGNLVTESFDQPTPSSMQGVDFTDDGAGSPQSLSER